MQASRQPQALPLPGPRRRRQFAVTPPGAAKPAARFSLPQVAVRAVAAEAASSTTGQPYGRVFNFSAGPAILPVEVLEQAQADLLNWRGSGEGALGGRGRQRGGLLLM